MPEASRRPAWVEIDLGAVRHNASVLARIVAPAGLCAVVKADAYGHGAVPVSLAALAGGAASLAVAITDEGVELREAGIEAPILVLSEPGADAMDEAIARGLTPTLYSAEGIALAGEAACRHGQPSPAGYPIEVKVDTGMHRVGAAPDDVVALVQAVSARDELAFAGLWTHLAVADEPDNEVTDEQLRRFAAVRVALAEAGCPEPGRLHAANSAGAIAWPAARFDVARCGIALYGYSPSPALVAALAAECARAASGPLEPVLSWKAHVSFVRSLPAGERVSYGLKAPLPEAALVATVPLGYADGIPRAYFSGGGEVLINGRRRRLAGVVTMDQIMIDCGDDPEVRPGDEVVLIGRQGSEQLTAEDWAARLDTIAYEVVTRIGPRVPRVHLGSGAGAARAATARAGAAGTATDSATAPERP